VLVVLLPTVADCTHVVGLIMFVWGANHLSRFSGVSHTFFYRFSTRFRRHNGIKAERPNI
jgi:hypothetical protein